MEALCVFKACQNSYACSVDMKIGEAIELHQVDPILRWLFVYMMVATLTWKAMSHADILSTLEGIYNVIDKSFFNMLNQLLTVDKINICIYMLTC